MSLAVVDRPSVERAHHLGCPYVIERCRPVTVTFLTFKIKELVMAERSRLRSHNVSVSEDYCQATRTAHNMLLSYAKSTPARPSFQLRYDKLSVNHKKFAYDASTDEVCENTAHVCTDGSRARNKDRTHFFSSHNRDRQACSSSNSAPLSHAQTSNAIS